MPSTIRRMLHGLGESFGSGSVPAMSSPDDLGLALHDAAVHGNKRRLRKLLKTGIAVDYPNDDGQTALFHACFEAQAQIVKILLAMGADPNVKSCEGITPMHTAAFSANVHIMACLVEHGGDLRLHDNHGRTIRGWAEYQHNTKKRDKMLDFLAKIKTLAMTSSGRNLAKEKQSKEFYDQLKLEGNHSLTRIFRRVRSLNSTALSRQSVQSMGFGKVYVGGSEEAGCFAPIPIVAELTLSHDNGGITYSNGPFTVNESMKWERTKVTAKRLHRKPVEGGHVDLLINEHSNMARLRHPNILLLMGICRTDEMDGLVLLYERVGLGNLYQYLHHGEGSMSIVQVCEVMQQVSDAVLYLHQRRLVHCWISSHSVHLVAPAVAKLGNMEYMIDNSGSDGKSPRSEVINNKHTNAAYNWLAPEVMAGETPTEVSDVYSLCAVIWECVYGQVPWNALNPKDIKREMLRYRKTLRLDRNMDRTLHCLLSVGLKSDETVRSTISIDEVKDTLRTVYEGCRRAHSEHKKKRSADQSTTSADSQSYLEESLVERDRSQKSTPHSADRSEPSTETGQESPTGTPGAQSTSSRSRPITALRDTNISTSTPSLRRNVGGVKIFKTHSKRKAPTPNQTPVPKESPQQADEEESDEETSEEEIESRDLQISREEEMMLKQMAKEQKLMEAKEEEMMVEKMAHEQVQMVMDQVVREQEEELAKEHKRRNKQLARSGNPFKQLTPADEQEVRSIAKAASTRFSQQQLQTGPSLVKVSSAGQASQKIKTGSEIIEAARSSTCAIRGYQQLSTTNKTIGLYGKKSTEDGVKSSQSSTVYKVLSQPLATLHSPSACRGQRVSEVQRTYLSQVESDGHSDVSASCQSAASLQPTTSSTHRLPTEPEAHLSPGNFKPASHRKSMDTGESPSKLRAESSVLVSPVPPQTGSLHKLYPPRAGSLVRRSLQTSSSPAGLTASSTLPRNFRSSTAKGSPGMPTSWDNYRSERYDQLVSATQPRDHSKTSPPRISPRESIGTWFGGGAANIQALILEFQQKWCNHEVKQSIISLKQKPEDFQGRSGKLASVNGTGDVRPTTKSWVKNSHQVMTTKEGSTNDELVSNEGRESLNSNNNATDDSIRHKDQSDVEEFYFDDEIRSGARQARHLRLQTPDVQDGTTVLRVDCHPFAKVPSVSLPATPSALTAAAGNSCTGTPNEFYFDDSIRAGSSQARNLRLQTPDATEGSAVSRSGQDISVDDSLFLPATPTLNETSNENSCGARNEEVPIDEPVSEVCNLPLRRESLCIAHITEHARYQHGDMEAYQEEEQDGSYADSDEEQAEEYADEEQVEYTDDAQAEEEQIKYIDDEQPDDEQVEYTADTQPEDEQTEYVNDAQQDEEVEEYVDEEPVDYIDDVQLQIPNAQSEDIDEVYEEQAESGSEYSDEGEVEYSNERRAEASFEVQL